jgi:hypothetical protein
VDLSKSCGFVVNLSKSCGFVVDWLYNLLYGEQVEFELHCVQTAAEDIFVCWLLHDAHCIMQSVCVDIEIYTYKLMYLTTEQDAPYNGRRIRRELHSLDVTSNLYVTDGGSMSICSSAWLVQSLQKLGIMSSRHFQSL